MMTPVSLTPLAVSRVAKVFCGGALVRSVIEPPDGRSKGWLSSVVVSAAPTISPSTLIARAVLLEPPSVPRSFPAFPGSQRTAWDVPLASCAEPTTCPLALMALTWLLFPPRVPRSSMV